MELFDLKQLGKNIKILRNNAGITQDALSMQIGASGKSAINNWEHGQNKPSDDYLQRMSDFFKVRKFRILFKDDIQLKKFVDSSINYQFEQIKSKLRNKKVLSQEQKTIWKLVRDYYSVRSIHFICSMTAFNAANQLISISKERKTGLRELRDNSLDIAFDTLLLKIQRSFLHWPVVQAQNLKELNAYKTALSNIGIVIYKNFEDSRKKLENQLDSYMSDDIGELIIKDIGNEFISRDFKISELKNILVEYFFQKLVSSTKALTSSDYKLPPYSQIKLLKTTLESLIFTILGAKKGVFSVVDFRINSSTVDLLNKEKTFIFQLFDSVCTTPNLYKDYRIDFKNYRGFLNSYFDGYFEVNLNQYMISAKDKALKLS